MRGHSTVARGDFTGRMAQAQQERKQDNEQARRNTINGLSERTVLVQVPGGRAYLVPTEVFEHVFGLGEASR